MRHYVQFDAAEVRRDGLVENQNRLLRSVHKPRRRLDNSDPRAASRDRYGSDRRVKRLGDSRPATGLNLCNRGTVESCHVRYANGLTDGSVQGEVRGTGCENAGRH